jgi:hypothetical protein
MCSWAACTERAACWASEAPPPPEAQPGFVKPEQPQLSGRSARGAACMRGPCTSRSAAAWARRCLTACNLFLWRVNVLFLVR